MNRKLILSLDTNNKEHANKLVNSLNDYISMIKIGHHVVSSFSFKEIGEVCKDFPIFLDLKFNDIPNTVIEALKNYSKNIPNISYFTFNGNLEDDNIKQIVSNSADINVKPIAVLILSSSAVNESEFLKIAIRNHSLGVTNFICPPAYIDIMRKQFGESITLFSPSIRNNTDISNDHSKTYTAKDAFKKGTNHIIVGRPLLSSSNPKEKIKEYI